MVRIVVRTDDGAMAANCGGAVETTYKTFDVALPREVEAFLREIKEKKWSYMQRQVVGVEVLDF
jgi:hypothetical protein